MNRAWPLPALETASDGQIENAAGNRENPTCRLNTVEDTFTRQRGLISLIYFVSHICYSRHCVELWLGKTPQREAIFPLLSCQAGRKWQRESCAFYVLVAGSCCVWTMSERLCSQSSQCWDSEWNMEGGKSLPVSANSNVSQWWMGYLDRATMNWANRQRVVTFSF